MCQCHKRCTSGWDAVVESIIERQTQAARERAQEEETRRVEAEVARRAACDPLAIAEAQLARNYKGR